jgi:hypothetical protein
MPKASALSQETFERLLQWLGPDREGSAAKYRQVHQRLTRLFEFKGCACPEDLADRVIDRVAKRIQDLPPIESGEQMGLFYSFVRYVYLEHLRERAPAALEQPAADSDVERRHQCLDLCLGRLADADRELILHYYRYPPGGKIQHRKAIAERMQIALNALRIRMCRLRSSIEQCVAQCVRSEVSQRAQ